MEYERGGGLARLKEFWESFQTDVGLVCVSESQRLDLERIFYSGATGCLIGVMSEILARKETLKGMEPKDFLAIVTELNEGIAAEIQRLLATPAVN